MTTSARPTTIESAHFYTAQGEPLYEIEKKSGGMRPFTLADAKKMSPRPLPSVTTILKVLHKEALVQWKVEQAVLAALTTPKLESETMDDFVFRVLHTERQQDQEAKVAADRGTQIHDALEKLFNGQPIDPEIDPWVRPAFEAINKGQVIATEKVLVGKGYAGRTDLIQRDGSLETIWDFKSTKTLPTKGAWPEHVLQLSAYARAYYDMTRTEKDAQTANLYISTTECGKFVVHKHDKWWWDTYENGFRPLVEYWQWANDFS